MDQENDVRDPALQPHVREIGEARERLACQVSHLKSRLGVHPGDWRAWVRRYPIQCEATAFAAGFLMGGPGGSARGGERSFLQELGRASLTAAIPRLLNLFLVQERGRREESRRSSDGGELVQEGS